MIGFNSETDFELNHQDLVRRYVDVAGFADEAGDGFPEFRETLWIAVMRISGPYLLDGAFVDVLGAVAVRLAQVQPHHLRAHGLRPGDVICDLEFVLSAQARDPVGEQTAHVDSFRAGMMADGPSSPLRRSEIAQPPGKGSDLRHWIESGGASRPERAGRQITAHPNLCL